MGSILCMKKQKRVGYDELHVRYCDHRSADTEEICRECSAFLKTKEISKRNISEESLLDFQEDPTNCLSGGPCGPIDWNNLVIPLLRI